MSVKIWSIEGNRQKLDGGAMFGNVPKAVWQNWCPPDEYGRIDLACRSMVAEVDSKLVLFEAGIGAFFSPKLAERFGVQEPNKHLLLEGLDNLGFSAKSIDMVVLSHLHFDHAGGILPGYEEIENGNNGLVFPNAEIVVGKEAWQRALKPHFRDRASFIKDLPQKIEASGKLNLVDEGQSLLNGRLQFFGSNGHTPGQLHSILEGDNESIVFCGDLIPGTYWVHIPITMGYDRFPELVIDEKVAFYKKAIDASYWLFYTHDTNYACSKVKTNEKAKVVPILSKECLTAYLL